MHTPVTTQLTTASSPARADFDVIIVGGGLAGLTSAIALAAQQQNVLLLEKKTYPYHKVCGEYISNEVLGYLQSLGFDPFAHGASNIKRLRVSTPKGKNIYAPLDLGGFGISRYTLDEALYQLAIARGATVQTDTRVTDIRFNGNQFNVTTHRQEVITGKLVIGSYGKREVLDKKLNRPFIQQHTRYMGVKYHIHTDYPVDEIGLDNFDGGYCGISKIEGDRYNLCYLYRRPQHNAHTSIQALQEAVLYQNPVLKQIFTNAEFLWDTPEVINEICFDPKSQVEDHILMCGDTAGLITPLCGNGMSMAIAGAKLLTDLVLKSGVLHQQKIPLVIRTQLERGYQAAWNKAFKTRLAWGRTIQQFFGNPLLTDISLRAIHTIPVLERALIKATHGKPL